MKRVRVFLIDGTCIDINNVEDSYAAGKDSQVLFVKCHKVRYTFNMTHVYYVEAFMEEEEDERNNS